MKGIRFSLWRAAAVLVALVVLCGFVACKEPDSEDLIFENVAELSKSDGIVGKWEDDYPDWQIYETYDCQISVGKVETCSYGGHEGSVYIAKLSQTSGYVYYQLKSDVTGYDDNGKEYEIHCAEKWSAVFYKDLTSNSVKMCDAFNRSSPYDFPDSLEKCVHKYTVENGYFENPVTFKKVED